MAYAKCIILGADGELGDAANNLLDNLRDLREQSESSSEGTPFSTDQLDERIRQQLGNGHGSRKGRWSARDTLISF